MHSLSSSLLTTQARLRTIPEECFVVDPQSVPSRAAVAKLCENQAVAAPAARTVSINYLVRGGAGA